MTESSLEIEENANERNKQRDEAIIRSRKVLSLKQNLDDKTSAEVLTAQSETERKHFV